MSGELTNDHNQTFENDWQHLASTNGEIDMDKVKRELHDYAIALDQVPQVYMELSGGFFSKLNTAAHHVIAKNEEITARYCEEAITERLHELLGALDALKHYFEDRGVDDPQQFSLLKIVRSMVSDHMPGADLTDMEEVTA